MGKFKKGVINILAWLTVLAFVAIMIPPAIVVLSAVAHLMGVRL
jgi:hypothetical protein